MAKKDDITDVLVIGAGASGGAFAWSLAQAGLSAWWSYEDEGHGWEPAIAVAEIFAGLIT